MLNVVLYQPEICPNTGNIIRTCYSLGARLHIIKPIAFDLHPKYLRRYGAGRMLSDIQHEVHDSYEEFNKKYGNKNIFYITRYGLKTYDEVDYQANLDKDKEIWVMFGRESTGIDMSILKSNVDKCLRIPMISEMRSINLANCVAIVGFEIMRQLKWKDLSLFEVQKGKNFILEWDKK
ncbi:tRNA (cytidine(34)-2'-O)-methyltransferase [Mycoplasmopsis anatis]|uniref:Putative tRNA (cytidine(34)-2'-O)-methyltransferase n=2 Tax=Mycoplasmopsis anatis TaxID=171279 RepID=F9QCZ2_9BACT|nr:tRNA (cytidine(34)-2'-O)-methyltransferase [Mycoplasmopsis anatis]AWX70483.1 tRNA (cytidine(34)-2'-O)-methyltransferase [Mycoplasmopsis anatis]EGS29374.1 rRNA methylase [Mycoplasmopsis anatis 1340]MBW0594851.1 tRNA (cytidine(34)-2'-O)-methyltransferase [Mycoplasmopsis anatis]MBW0595632.1 tRNA (cytidine(34)-2'-O)-methyltransferase [Mycoplasmopsis anatis]MBW0595978.1 tRNA (cytidine(34)-2'-O)-methyltransferase [Mycoplasmopsis anatis]